MAGPGRIVFVLKGYPRLSETFVAQEIAALEQRGLDIAIVSLRHPTDRLRHPVHERIRAPLLYLPEYLHQEPLRVLKALLAALARPGRLGTVLRLWARDWARDRTRNRLRRLGQALVLAREMPAGTVALHAHFLHTPASVTRYAAHLVGLPWTASAHARDIWTSPDWEKREKLADCTWAVTCTAANRDHLAVLAPPGRVELVYHGLDLSRFNAPPPRQYDPQAVPTILSVGRLVEKKGYDDLLRALALLPADLAWRFVHVGGGPLKADLAALAAELGLTDRIDWQGAQTQDAVLAHYRRADLFVLCSRIAGDGDRDGLPNVLVEAQSQGLPCVSTRVSAIPELLEDGVNGRLVDAGAPDQIASALAALLREPDGRRAMGRAGETKVRAHFALDGGIDRLWAKFGGGSARP